jgi:hypothetical protein
VGGWEGVGTKRLALASEALNKTATTCHRLFCRLGADRIPRMVFTDGGALSCEDAAREHKVSTILRLSVRPFPPTELCVCTRKSLSVSHDLSDTSHTKCHWANNELASDFAFSAGIDTSSETMACQGS